MAKSSLKMGKKALCLIFAFLLSIDVFAAVVTGNDGAAFITKAEFEALKTDFESQLIRYNNSIDSKIDGAIALFLDGNKVSERQMVRQMNNYKTIRWMHGPYMYFTNRHFTVFSAAEGNYVDTVGWQILKPENRRQTSSDAYMWSYDNIRSNFNNYHVAFMLYPSSGVTKQWGIAYGTSAHRYGPSIYVECEKIDGNWVLTDDTINVFRGELGYVAYLYARPHGGNIVNPFSWSGEKNLTSTNLNGVLQYYDIGDSNDIIGYNARNIPNTTGDTTSEVWSHIQISHNPNFPATHTCGLWQSSVPLKTACGECGYGLTREMYIDDGLVEDNRWKTESQFRKDCANFQYSLFGANVDDSIKVNVAPKRKDAPEGSYLDLTDSGESVSYNAKMQSYNIVNTVPWGTKNPHCSWIYDSARGDQEFKITIPLFYRLTYSDIRNRFHKTLSGEYLKKGDGYPIIEEATDNGYLSIKINYEEKADVDSSVVGSITPDNKIKTYFKNKRFTDNTGTFYEGYTNVKGTGKLVSLNGTEWTKKEITVNIPVKKGDAIWMRIDPLTENGVYCLMNNIEAMFVAE